MTLPDLTYSPGVSDERTTEIYTDGITTGNNDLKILSFCFGSSHTAKEIAEYIAVTASTYFRKNTLERLCGEGYLSESKGERSIVFSSNNKKVRLKL